jgi:hypothetical protein
VIAFILAGVQSTNRRRVQARVSMQTYVEINKKFPLLRCGLYAGCIYITPREREE